MEGLLLALINKVKEIAQKLGLISDYVVEQGTSGDWNYVKWNSGRCELACGYYVNTTQSTAWQNSYFSEILTKELPFTVISVRSINGCTDNVSYICNSSLQGNAIAYLIGAPHTIYAGSYYVMLDIIGRWK